MKPKLISDQEKRCIYACLLRGKGKTYREIGLLVPGQASKGYAPSLCERGKRYLARELGKGRDIYDLGIDFDDDMNPLPLKLSKPWTYGDRCRKAWARIREEREARPIFLGPGYPDITFADLYPDIDPATEEQMAWLSTLNLQYARKYTWDIF